MWTKKFRWATLSSPGASCPPWALADAVSRMLPGVLSAEECFEEESHYNGLLEYPQYTRPALWRGRETPEVLLSGHHANIARWRRQQSLLRTAQKRPELLKTAPLTREDLEFLRGCGACQGLRGRSRRNNFRFFAAYSLNSSIIFGSPMANDIKVFHNLCNLHKGKLSPAGRIR